MSFESCCEFFFFFPLETKEGQAAPLDAALLREHGLLFMGLECAGAILSLIRLYDRAEGFKPFLKDCLESIFTKFINAEPVWEDLDPEWEHIVVNIAMV